MKEESIVVDVSQPAITAILYKQEWFNLHVNPTPDKPVTCNRHVEKSQLDKVEYLIVYFILRFIDDILKHNEKLLWTIPKFDEEILTKLGNEDIFINDKLEIVLENQLEVISEFICDYEWNTYEWKLVGSSLFIKRCEDWRVIQYERLTAPEDI